MSFDSVQGSPELGPLATSPLRRPMRRLGMASLALAIAFAALEALAIGVGSGGQWQAATVLAWFVMGLLAASFVLGMIAILTANGRRFGIAAVIVSVLAHPLLLVWLLRLLGARE